MTKSFKFLPITASFACLVNTNLSGAVFSYEFTGTVTSVSGADMTPFASVNDPVIGTMSYDTDIIGTTVFFLDQDAQGFGLGDAGSSIYSVTIGGNSWSIPVRETTQFGSNLMALGESSVSDAWSFRHDGSAGSFPGNSGVEGMSFNISDRTALFTLLDGKRADQIFQTSSIIDGTGMLELINATTGTLEFDILSVTAVPEPSAALFFCVGTAATILRRRRS